MIGPIAYARTDLTGQVLAVLTTWTGRRVTLLVGSGDNGGDALYAGVRLLNRGVRVRAWRTSSAVHDAAWTAFVAAGG